MNVSLLSVVGRKELVGGLGRLTSMQMMITLIAKSCHTVLRVFGPERILSRAMVFHTYRKEMISSWRVMNVTWRCSM